MNTDKSQYIYFEHSGHQTILDALEQVKHLYAANNNFKSYELDDTGNDYSQACNSLSSAVTGKISLLWHLLFDVRKFKHLLIDYVEVQINIDDNNERNIYQQLEYLDGLLYAWLKLLSRKKEKAVITYQLVKLMWLKIKTLSDALEKHQLNTAIVNRIEV